MMVVTHEMIKVCGDVCSLLHGQTFTTSAISQRRPNECPEYDME